jgi:cell division protein FtsB
MNILTQYDQVKKEEPAVEDKIRNIKATIEALQKQLEKLESASVEVLSSDERSETA